jgi:NADH-ubiquinone oxidoreductase chain 3
MINLATTYQEKDSVFECGFHSFLGQNRSQFSISFFIFALLFLLFDLEILLVYPYVVSAYTNGIYGLVIMLVFFLALTLGFAFEMGKGALKISSRQNNYLSESLSNKSYSIVVSWAGRSNLNAKGSQANRRGYSTLAFSEVSASEITNVAATYNDPESLKAKIMKDNNHKAGVYMWKHIITGKHM